MTEDYDESDLYDDILCQQDQENNLQTGDVDINDLYENIHNPEVAETALEKVKTLTSENDKLKSRISTLKEQVRILQDLNSQLTETNSNLENNMKQLIETARTEINRKNTEIIDRQSKLEDVLFRRAARNITSRELESIMEKFSLRQREESLRRLPTNLDRMRTGSKNSPDVSNVSNRQFVRKKRTVSSEAETSQNKRVKLDEESVEKSKGKEESCLASNEKEKTLNTDVSLISKYVKGNERRKKVKEVPNVSSQTDQASEAEARDQKKKEKEKTEEHPRWFCEIHNEGFRVREELREHNRLLHSRDERKMSGSKPLETSSSSESVLPLQSVEDKEKDETEASGIIRIPINNEQTLGDRNEDAVSEGYKSGEDIISLDIDTTERFDEEDSLAGSNSKIYFKSLETNFNIPKVSSSERERRSEKEKKVSASSEEKRRERKSRRESEDSSGEREGNKSRGRGRSSSRSRRRKQQPRSVSRPRRSRSRQRRRRTSRERGREKEREDRRKRRSTSRRRRRSPSSASGERRRRRSPNKTERRARVARRSQSLSPARLRRTSEVGEREEVDMDQLEDLSLAELKRLKEKIKGKKGLNDDLEPVRPDSPQEVEDGEVLSEDEEGQKEERNRKIQDLRQKLTKDSDSPVAARKQAEVSVDDSRYSVQLSHMKSFMFNLIKIADPPRSLTSARRSRPGCRTTASRTLTRSSSPLRSVSSTSFSSRRSS